MPAFALPLVKHVVRACLEAAVQQDRLKGYLLCVFGDLEEVWVDAAQHTALLELPLRGMELLLSSTELRVASEDTVLYTAQAYVDQLPTATAVQRAEQERAAEALAPLIRCPHLPRFWLMAAALSSQPGPLLLKLQGAAKQLLFTLETAPGAAVSDEVMREEVPDPPPSWLLPPRSHRPLTDGVRLKWTVAVEEIRRVAKESGESRQTVDLYSPRTAPLGGVRWFMLLKAGWDAATASSTIGLFAMVEKVPPGMVCEYSFKLWCEGYDELEHVNSTRLCNRQGWGLANFFKVGPMADGWDEGRWSETLPPTGELTLNLHVTKVGHMKASSA